MILSSRAALLFGVVLSYLRMWGGVMGLLGRAALCMGSFWSTLVVEKQFPDISFFQHCNAYSTRAGGILSKRSSRTYLRGFGCDTLAAVFFSLSLALLFP
jgi:hypothetical protein